MTGHSPPIGAREGSASAIASAPAIAVVVATRDRAALLATRALPSISAQTRLPDHLVVIDDSSEPIRGQNRDTINRLTLRGCRVLYTHNARTPGASGSWNTALDELLATVADPAQTYVAILDDDDAWAPAYLESCHRAVTERRLDMVAAGLRRIADGGIATASEAPAELRAEAFLAGNPGIQGSNLFVRLSVLLAAGGFDEALPSTTDRDLCVRIADLGGIRYGRVPLPLVDHYADEGRARLSTRGSQVKLAGLTAFWRKHVGRMSAAQRRAFTDRAETLFGWRPPGPDTPRTALILGLFVDNERPDALRGVIDALASCDDDGLLGLDVALLERGEPSPVPSLLDAAAAELRSAGAGCFRFARGRQAERGVEPQLHPRELLAAYCGRIARARTGAEIWLTDDLPDETPPRGGRIHDVLRWLGAERLDTRSGAESSAPELERWIDDERLATAEHRVKRRFAIDRLRLLGRGSEGIVFTDGRTVYKCIDYWKTRAPASQLDFLREQVGRWSRIPGLYALRQVEVDGPWALITYDYESSEPYRGGHEDDMRALLTGCTEAGIVCNNVHPKNLILTATGVKLIDYGSDIRPWSALGFEHMARRAFLSCRHAAHPELKALMRRALHDLSFPEMAGYADFRATLAIPQPIGDLVVEAPSHPPFALYVGVITSEPETLLPLLLSLLTLLTLACMHRMRVVILDNGAPPAGLAEVAAEARARGLPTAIVGLAQQRRDAARGAFGAALRARPDGQVGIACARTMLQRYIGALQERDPGSIAWLLDDDMRVDDRAAAYLPWLPSFRERGVDVLLGAYEGASPNPPLNGLRVQLVDLFHNLLWLRGLAPQASLPDRGPENAAARAKHPDYYYDLSRRHTAHLEAPHWLEPAARGETVAEARARLLRGAAGILRGAPLTRPLVAQLPSSPLSEARDSVNRGGCTFVLNPRALTQTPNLITQVGGREARRSDMIWAIINRHYRRMTIKAVGFPVLHVSRVTAASSLDLQKVQGELVGSALYAALVEFLRARPEHALSFAPREIEAITGLAAAHLNQRLRALERSIYRIEGLREALRATAGAELNGLLALLDRWFTREAFLQLRADVSAQRREDVAGFLAAMRGAADDYASVRVDVDFIADQLDGRATASGASAP